MKKMRFLGVLVAGFLSSAIVAACSGGESTAGAGTGGGGSCTCEVKKPDVAIEVCNHHFTNANTFTDFYYAEHSYPGATIDELATVTAVGVMPTDPKNLGTGSPAEFTTTAKKIDLLWLGDGKVAVYCGGPGYQPDYVIFTKP